MGTDLQVRPEQESESPQPGTRPSLRKAWNWFGAVFGVVVLLGGAILYVSSGSDSGTDGARAAAQLDAGGQQPDEPMAADEDGSAHGHEMVEASGEGFSGKNAGAADVIEIEMVDFAYVPEEIDIPAGTPVLLRFINNGTFEHEAMIGDAHMQEEFAEEGDHAHGDEGGEGHHGDVMAVTVQPGETADLEVVIDEPGEWYVACHITGHYEQGQVGTINVI